MLRTKQTLSAVLAASGGAANRAAQRVLGQGATLVPDGRRRALTVRLGAAAAARLRRRQVRSLVATVRAVGVHGASGVVERRLSMRR